MPVVNGVRDGLGDVVVHPGVTAPQDLERHELRAPGHARDADAIVADRAGDAGDVRAVAVVVSGPA